MNDTLYTDAASVIERTRTECRDEIEQAARLLCETVDEGGIILTCGNGGSAAQASHMAAELMVRFRETRGPIAALNLAADGAVVTAGGNDFGFESVFDRTLYGFREMFSCLVALSTSGSSKNIVGAVHDGSWSYCNRTILITGNPEGRTAAEEVVFDVGFGHLAVIRIPSTDTAAIQTATLVVIHDLCDAVERHLLKEEEL